MENSNYHRDQLAKVRPGRAGTYAAKFKITHGSDSTNWLDLHDASAVELERWLAEYYNTRLTENKISMWAETHTLKELIMSAFPAMTPEQFDRHETDLYVKNVPGLRKWLKENYKFYGNILPFISQIDRTEWLDIPFAAWSEKYPTHINEEQAEEPTTADKLQELQDVARRVVSCIREDGHLGTQGLDESVRELATILNEQGANE